MSISFTSHLTSARLGRCKYASRIGMFKEGHIFFLQRSRREKNERTSLANEEVNLQCGPLSPFGTTANFRMVNDRKCLVEIDLDLAVAEERVTSGHSWTSTTVSRRLVRDFSVRNCWSRSAVNRWGSMVIVNQEPRRFSPVSACSVLRLALAYTFRALISVSGTAFSKDTFLRWDFLCSAACQRQVNSERCTLRPAHHRARGHWNLETIRPCRNHIRSFLQWLDPLAFEQSRPVMNPERHCPDQ